MFDLYLWNAIEIISYLQYIYIRYEKLQRWDDALKAYTAKASQVTSAQLVLETTLGL